MTEDLQPATWCAVVPAYQEAARIEAVIRGVLAQGVRVVVVDDGSTDETARVAAEAGASVIRHAVNRGKGAALQSGMCRALESGARWVITLDADGQHDPSDLIAFLREAKRGECPILVGNRMHDTRTMPWVRRLTNRVMSAWLSRMIGQRVPDTQCGFRAYRADVLQHARCEGSHFDAESELLVRLARRGYRIGSVPIRTIYRGERSKINPLTDTIRFMALLIRLRRSRGFKRPR